MQRVTYRGVTLNTRTRDMIQAAEFFAGRDFVLTQGSYNPGGVQASAGTHDGGGAADIRAKDLTPMQRQGVVIACRMVGFAAWLRTPSQSDWPYHVHVIAIGDPELSAGAARQVTAYLKGRNGLASNGQDDGPRDWVGVRWEQVEAEMEELLKEVRGLRTDVGTMRTELSKVAAQLRSHDAEEDGRYVRYEKLFAGVRDALATIKAGQ